jgi:hypothetical protein
MPFNGEYTVALGYDRKRRSPRAAVSGRRFAGLPLKRRVGSDSKPEFHSPTAAPTVWHEDECFGPSKARSQLGRPGREIIAKQETGPVGLGPTPDLSEMISSFC